MVRRRGRAPRRGAAREDRVHEGPRARDHGRDAPGRRLEEDHGPEDAGRAGLGPVEERQVQVLGRAAPEVQRRRAVAARVHELLALVREEEGALVDRHLGEEAVALAGGGPHLDRRRRH